MKQPYFWGGMALLALYIISLISAFKKHGTRAFLPWAAAFGNNDKLSTSQLQFLIWTGVTVFAYCTMFAARAIDSGNAPVKHLPEIPINLMLLMGFSATTTAASKGITLSYLAQGQLDANKDASGVLTNRDGTTALIKVQMLIWTLISATIYLISFTRWVDSINLSTMEYALPDIDGALLVLMGVAQGGYIGGKLVSKTTGEPMIEMLTPLKAKIGEEVQILGLRFGIKEHGQLMCQDASDTENLTILETTTWAEDSIKFIVPDSLAPTEGEDSRKFKLTVRSNGLISDAQELETLKDPDQ